MTSYPGLASRSAHEILVFGSFAWASRFGKLPEHRRQSEYGTDGESEVLVWKAAI